MLGEECRLEVERGDKWEYWRVLTDVCVLLFIIRVNLKEQKKIYKLQIFLQICLDKKLQTAQLANVRLKNSKKYYWIKNRFIF